MKLTVAHKYLVFPVNHTLPHKKLFFHANGDFVYEQDIRLDNVAPDFYAYLDVARFMGMTLDITVSPEMEIVCREADEIDRADLGHEYLRPIYHFTEKNGWHNDPNGLVRDAMGTYHMYYQLNPSDTRWGNMHWGHATSPDMVHWTQKEIALFPDTFGTMYSGSGYLDTDNVAGFGENALLFYYTAAGGNNLRSEGKPFTQCMAYSLDNGMTLHKYEGNPVIPHIVAANRDPKVIYCEELSKYVIALYLTDNDYALFTSDDLKRWEQIQKITLPNDSECPDFYPLTADDGTRHWVLSGASAKYLIGDVKDGQFVPTQEVRAMHEGSYGYAAQTYSTLPDGRRINVAWERIDFPKMPFCSQMSLPIVHTLKRDENGYALFAEPSEEVYALRKTELCVNDGCADTDTPALELILSIPTGEDITLSVLGQHFKTENGYFKLLDGGKYFSEEQKIKLYEKDGVASVHLFLDTCTTEVFSGDFYACFHTIFDRNLKEVKLTGNGTLTGWTLAL